jgi:hypothetical protein
VTPPRAILLFLILIETASAQFVPALLQNESYWGDNKAEYDLYDTQLVRDGQTRQCEVLHIFARDLSDPKIVTLRFNQIIHAPAGLILYQQMHSSFFQVDNGLLLNASFTSSDAVGNTFKELSRVGENVAFDYRSSEHGASKSTQNIVLPANAYFYDELPLRVRAIDFSKSKGEFEIQIAPTIINAKKDPLVFAPAKVSFDVSERKIEVLVKYAAGSDRFLLDSQFPFLLREWTAADGSHYKMKNSLRVDYPKYNKNGDRERALKDPMLRHPD